MTASDLSFVPRRGRPSAKQAAAIEAAIVATAQRKFLAEGFGSVTMDAIAADAGVAKGTLYTRYPSKEELFHAVIVATVSRWSERAGADDDKLTDDIGQRLRHHAKTIAQAQCDPEVQAFQRLILENSERFPDLARSMHEAGFRFTVNLIAADIRAAARRDGVSAFDPDDVAQRLVVTVAGWCQQHAGVRELTLVEVEAFADRTVQLLLAARSLW